MDDVRAPPRDTIITGAALAFVAGFADACSFVGADGVFCAHITGNFVVLAADIVRHAQSDEWLKLATFPIFVVSVLGATSLHRRLRIDSVGRSMRLLFALTSLLFGAAAAIALAVPASSSGAPRSAIVALLVAAMGIQNALHRLNPTLGPMTTVMTGNVTEWFVETVIPGAPALAQKHRRLGVVILWFAVGCATGALGIAQIGFAVLVVPMAIALFLRSRIR
jgi:uncharacterized membrane protein YoaK (UPF0700 family)